MIWLELMVPVYELYAHRLIVEHDILLYSYSVCIHTMCKVLAKHSRHTNGKGSKNFTLPWAENSLAVKVRSFVLSISSRSLSLLTCSLVMCCDFRYFVENCDFYFYFLCVVVVACLFNSFHSIFFSEHRNHINLFFFFQFVVSVFSLFGSHSIHARQHPMNEKRRGKKTEISSSLWFMKCAFAVCAQSQYIIHFHRTFIL